MNITGIEKKSPSIIKKRGQFAAAFGIIAMMLYLAGFPVFLLLFVGVLSFFIWKVFSAEGRAETRRIFEFYLSANEMLRDDERLWYGFEIQETIERGEAIVRSMNAAPPLVYFGLGALYHKLGDHAAAVSYLEHVEGVTGSNESTIVAPSRELREYVRMLRKIERAPAEAPLTSSAVRSLERARKNRAAVILEYSRAQLEAIVPALPETEQRLESIVDVADGAGETSAHNATHAESLSPEPFTPNAAIKPNGSAGRRAAEIQKTENSPPERMTISEVLHDIYDKK